MRILLVDDDENFCDLASYHLGLNPENIVTTVHTGKDFEKALKQNPVDVVCIDYFLPDTTGDKLLAYVNEHYPATDKIMVSSQDDINKAIELLRKGAFDYVTKDENAFKKLWSVLGNIGERRSLKTEVQSLQKRLKQVELKNSPIIGEHESIQKINELIERAAGSHINVIVSGETGTGKELVAQTIHNNSVRSKKTFVAINVAAIPAELLESELFGHKKGAFTGAHSDRKGKFEEADGGTIFLDEIAEMDMSLQAKILRVLQESEVTRIGDNKPKKLNFRLIVATHKNLKKQVERGGFREDLYYRLMGLRIELPAIRERGTDVILLADYFIKKFADEYGVETKKLTKEARKKLMMHNFSGNVRELKSVMDLAMVMSDGEEILPEALQLESVKRSGLETALTGDEKTMKEYEIYILKYYLEKYNFDVQRVAETLDIGRSSIYRTISKHKLKE